MPAGLPSFDWPDDSSDSWLLLAKAACVLALIGSIVTLLTLLVADSIMRDSGSPNQELIGQGMGNTVSGLIAGLPDVGTTLTTVVNIRSGGRTAVSGVIVAALFFALVLDAGAVPEPIPQAVLAGLLMKMGWEIIDWRFVRHVFQIGRGHIVVMLLTLLLTLFVDLMVAVGIGLIVAGMADVVRSERLELERVLSVPLLEGDPNDPYLARIGVAALRGRFTVTSSNALVRVVTADLEDHEVVIFDFSRTSSLGRQRGHGDGATLRSGGTERYAVGDCGLEPIGGLRAAFARGARWNSRRSIRRQSDRGARARSNAAG